MKHKKINSKPPYKMEFDPATIKHLGFQMYSTLPQVIGELVANAWDANATKVEISLPDTLIDEETSEIVIIDNGIGMADKDVRFKYLRIGRNRREKEQTGDETPSPFKRKVMGRKGIGKFSAFGIAKEIVVESVKDEETSHFRMNYEELIADEDNRSIEFDPLSPTGTVHKGTKITLKYITKYHTTPIRIGEIRRVLARRFAVIGAQYDFEVIINDKLISINERNLKSKLARDENGDLYLWEYNETEIKDETGWTVSGWIGALDRTSQNKDKIGKDKVDRIDTGIVLMARGKLVQEPFVFGADVGQHFALSYLTGELHVEFTDEREDTIATARNSLVWDAEWNEALRKWGVREVNKIADLWANKRREANERKLQEHPIYIKFKEEANKIDKKREFKRADQLVQQLILKSLDKSPNADIEDFESVVDMFINFWQFDSFQEMAENIRDAGVEEPDKLLNLFREWEILEAKEMMKVTEGRITTIKQLQKFIDTNAKEVPTIHNFLKKFPWVLDPRWTLVADEHRYSDLLRDQFSNSDDDIPEVNRRIDFLCVREGTHLVVVEIKRPHSKIRIEELNQVERYVTFIEGKIIGDSDPDVRYEDVTGYLLCGEVSDDNEVQAKMTRLSQTKIYVRRYKSLLGMVEELHAEILKRYNQLQEKKEINQL